MTLGQAKFTLTLDKDLTKAGPQASCLLILLYSDRAVESHVRPLWLARLIVSLTSTAAGHRTFQA